MANITAHHTFELFFPGLRIRIRIQSGQWIRIRIWNPDPGGKKLPTKVEKICKSSCFEVLDGLF